MLREQHVHDDYLESKQYEYYKEAAEREQNYPRIEDIHVAEQEELKAQAAYNDIVCKLARNKEERHDLEERIFNIDAEIEDMLLGDAFDTISKKWDLKRTLLALSWEREKLSLQVTEAEKALLRAQKEHDKLLDMYENVR